MKTETDQHTATPWEVEHTDDGYIRIINDNGDIPVEDSGYGRHPLIVSTSDAAFIVRAVNNFEELLASAKEVMNTLADDGPSIVPHLMDTDDNAGQRLREAIAKAEGR